MFSPFLDLKAMSEEELLSKITTLTTRMQYAQNFVGDRTMINSLGVYLEAYQNEFQERQIVRANDQWTSQFPAIIESEPDLKISTVKKPGAPGGPELRPAFNKKFVRPDLDITPVPTRHAEKKADDKK
jgi:hypothetical protein